MATVFTIGFTKRSAASFFNAIREAGVKRLLDVRLNNSSQLAAFAKKDDLAYFLEAICKAEYMHEPLLAPTQEMLDTYKKAKGSWSEYEKQFLALMQQRRIEETLDPCIFDVPTVLLCSEATAEHCHRRLVIEYLQKRWADLSVIHL
jgi:uncharacterized protein (DUF488 family)